MTTAAARNDNDRSTGDNGRSAEGKFAFNESELNIMAYCYRRRKRILATVCAMSFMAFTGMVMGLPPFCNDPKDSGASTATSKPQQKQFSYPQLPEKNHIVYIRIPKTGSSTMTLLLWRYAWARNLSVLAVHPSYQGTRARLNPKEFFLPPPGEKCDVMAEHVFYDKKNYAPYFYEDNQYVTLLREPMNMLHSTLYYINEFRQSLRGEDKIESYLRNPQWYDKVVKMAGRSYTHNPQSTYLGLREADFKSVEKIQELIKTTDREFPLVMILEKFDESLILFRRLTNWPIKDLIYHIENINNKKPSLKISSKQREMYRKWSLADHMLYDYFSQKLDRQIEELSPSFQAELELFKKYNSEVAYYCRFQTITDEDLVIPDTPYHEGFTVSRRDCSMIHAEPLILISAIRRRQHSSPYMSPNLLAAIPRHIPVN